MCIRYEEIKSQIRKMINQAEENREAVKDNDEAWSYWEHKADHLYNALRELELAQYQKKPEMN